MLRRDRRDHRIDGGKGEHHRSWRVPLVVLVLLGQLVGLAVVGTELRSTQQEFNEVNREVVALRSQLPPGIDVNTLYASTQGAAADLLYLAQETEALRSSIGSSNDYDSVNSNIADLDSAVDDLDFDLARLVTDISTIASRLRTIEGSQVDTFSLDQNLTSLDRRLDNIERCFTSSFGC